jgi:hypothetical protein
VRFVWCGVVAGAWCRRRTHGGVLVHERACGSVTLSCMVWCLWLMITPTPSTQLNYVYNVYFSTNPYCTLYTAARALIVRHVSPNLTPSPTNCLVTMIARQLYPLRVCVQRTLHNTHHATTPTEASHELKSVGQKGRDRVPDDALITHRISR